MFSAVFNLLLAGAMLSQVFSTRPILLVVFESINDELVDAKMPLLREDGELGRNAARLGPVKSENLTKSFPTLHTIATGVLPNEHGVIADKMFNKNGEEMFNTHEQFHFNPKIKPLWEEAAANRNTTATFMWPGANFSPENEYRIVTEEYKISGEPWGSRISKIKSWFTGEGIKLGMAYFEDTDKTESVDSYTTRVEDAIKELYNGLKDINVDMIVMSNHGTKEIKKNHVLNINEFVEKSDCNCEFIVSGSVSFLRFKNSQDLETTYDKLQRNTYHGTRFKVYKNNEATLIGWNLNNFSLLENTLFVATFQEYLFYDEENYKTLEQSGVNIVRESGFGKQDSDMNGVLFFFGPSFEKNVVNKKAFNIQLKDLYVLTKVLLGIEKIVIHRKKIKSLNPDISAIIKSSLLQKLLDTNN